MIIITAGKIYTPDDAIFAVEPFPHYWWRTVEVGKDKITRTWLHQIPLVSIDRIATLEKEEHVTS